MSIYPSQHRSRWIEARRPQRNRLDPWKPYALLAETEPNLNGETRRVSTIFLTNKECPWRCLMCDLWKNTLERTVRVGAIPGQIRHALKRLPPADHIKLYNSGSFFDRAAVPVVDYTAIASLTAGFERIIVESHPRLVGKDTFAFRDLLQASIDDQKPAGAELEVAIGLETVHEKTLERLNKRCDLKQFGIAARRLVREGVPWRAFVLVKPPFQSDDEALVWAYHSIDFAFEHGAETVSLIPVRAGNGAMEALQGAGEFAPPRLSTFEAALEYGLSLNRGRVLADLWDLDRLLNCEACSTRRHARLEAMNYAQRCLPQERCPVCSPCASAAS